MATRRQLPEEATVRAVPRRLAAAVGGQAHARAIVLLAAVLALSSADSATIGAVAAELKRSLSITNTDVGLLAAVTSLVGAAATIPFGMLTDRVNCRRADARASRRTTRPPRIGSWTHAASSRTPS